MGSQAANERATRRPGRLFALWLGLAAAAAFLLTPAARGQCEYDVTAVFEGPDVWGSPAPISVTGMNEHGHIVGHYSFYFGDDAFLWTPDDGLVTLPRPPGSGTARAYDINDDGDIVGYMEQTDSNLYSACVWRDGLPIDLGQLPDGDESMAMGINKHSQIVGYSNNSIHGPMRAFLWENGEMTDLSTLLGTEDSVAYAINDKSQITGWMGTSTVHDSVAFVIHDGKVLVLPLVPGGTGAYGRDINERGWVVGAAFAEFRAVLSVTRHAIFYRSGRTVDLGTLPDDERSLSTDINLRGQAVGYSDQGSGGYRAVVWQNGRVSPLDDLLVDASGLELRVPGGVSDSGQIVTNALDPSGNLVGVLLTPSETVPGDVDRDCNVDIDDLFAVLGFWGPCEGCPEDLNEDGIVDVQDLLSVIENWG